MSVYGVPVDRLKTSEITSATDIIETQKPNNPEESIKEAIFYLKVYDSNTVFSGVFRNREVWNYSFLWRRKPDLLNV